MYDMMKKMLVVIGILILLTSVACACLAYSYHPHPLKPQHSYHPHPPMPPCPLPTVEPTIMPTAHPTPLPGDGDKVTAGKRNMFVMGMITAIQDMQRNPAICHEIETVSRFARYPQFEKGYDLMAKKIINYRFKSGVC